MPIQSFPSVASRNRERFLVVPGPEQAGVYSVPGLKEKSRLLGGSFLLGPV